MQNRRNYYRILHVQPDAPQAVIRASYRTLMQKLRLHPDLGGDDWNAALLNEAYRTLSDPERRAAYDRSCEQQRAGRGAAGRRSQGAGAAAGSPERNTAAAPSPRALLCPFCTASNLQGRHYASSDHCVNCHSPLTPAAEVKPISGDRRGLARQPVELNVTWFDRWPQARGRTGLATDLTACGMQLVSDRRLATNTFVKIDAGPFAAIARVASCRPHAGGRFCIGLRFVTLAVYRKAGLFISESA